jgi:anti-sigma factor RsiW
MRCDEARWLMSESLDRRLSESSSGKLQTHLQTCCACLSRWQAMQHVSSLFAAADFAKPPPDFTARVMKRVQTAEQAKAAHVFERPPLAVAWAIATTILLLAAVLALYAVQTPAAVANSAAPSIDLPAVAVQISGEAIGGAILFEKVATAAYDVTRIVPQAAISVILGWMVFGTLALAITLAGVINSYWPRAEAFSESQEALRRLR